MSVLFPHRRTTTVALGLLLVDLPVFLAVLALGFRYGFVDVYMAITDWRLDHPWTFAPTIALAVVLAWRWWRA